MERSRLAQLLAGADEVRLLARAALEAGAEYRVWPGGAELQSLVTIYGRRERLTRRLSQPTLGFTEALDSLHAYDGAELAIGFIDDRPRGGYYFQLFLDLECSAVIACLGVKLTRQ